MLESMMNQSEGGYPRHAALASLPGYNPALVTSMMGKIWGLNLLSPPNSDTTESEDNKTGKNLY